MTPTEIYPYLWQSGRFDDYGDTDVIVNTQSEHQDNFLVPRTKPLYLWFPIAEGGYVREEDLDTVVIFIIESLYQKNKVVVHSEKGENRSTLIIAAVLMRLLGLTPISAYEKVKEKNEAAYLNEEQQKSLLNFYDFIAKQES